MTAAGRPAAGIGAGGRRMTTAGLLPAAGA
jgi:hypothetical protein